MGQDVARGGYALAPGDRDQAGLDPGDVTEAPQPEPALASVMTSGQRIKRLEGVAWE